MQNHLHSIFEKEIKEILPQTIAWYKHLHQYPELSHNEFQTSDYVYNQIQNIKGIDEVTRPTKTSIMVKLIGNEKGKTIALRADIDALPIFEETDIDYKSKNPGVMHACGHDAHTTILLSTLKLLASMKEKIKGEVRFIFQHAEEVNPGGATELCKTNVIDGVDNIFAYHVHPHLETGKFTYKNGFFCASTDSFEIRVLGKGAHASTPHLAIDPIVIASQIITNLQNIVSRTMNPLNVPVITIGSFQAGTTNNIIPDNAILLGTLRALGENIRKKAKDHIYNTVEHITKAHNAKYEIIWDEGDVSGYNDEQATSTFVKSLTNIVGEQHVIDAKYPMYGGEDFSLFLEKVKGSMVGVGIANKEKQTDYSLHSNKFKIDLDMFPYAISGFMELIKDQCFK